MVSSVCRKRASHGILLGRRLARPVVELARRLLEKRHQVRLALKRLRYGVEFLGGLFPGKAAKRYATAAWERFMAQPLFWHDPGDDR
jgi:CHAD domain-containing protein